MTTEYTHRVTIAAPAAHMADANQLALCLGESPADNKTFFAENYEDGAGNLYAVCSTVAKPIFVERSAEPLSAPDYAPDADLEAASRAQSILAIGEPAAPDRIAAIVGDRLESAQGHLAQLGLARVENDSPEI